MTDRISFAEAIPRTITTVLALLCCANVVAAVLQETAAAAGSLAEVDAKIVPSPLAAFWPDVAHARFAKATSAANLICHRAAIVGATCSFIAIFAHGAGAAISTAAVGTAFDPLAGGQAAGTAEADRLCFARTVGLAVRAVLTNAPVAFVVATVGKVRTSAA